MAQGTTKGVPIDKDATLSNNSDLLVPSQKAVKTYVDSGLAGKQTTLGYTPVNRSGDTMTGSLILNANPSGALEAATKDYVDTLINGIDWKAAAQSATVASLPAYTVSGAGQILTGNVNGVIPSATTDNRAVIVNERLLVKNETSTLTPNNGIYVVTQVGSGSLPFILTRTQDANTSSELAESTLGVNFGTTLANTQWHCNPAALPVVIGTTYITFAQIGSGVYTNGAGLDLTGNIFSIANNGVTDAMIQSSSTWNDKPNGYYQNTAPTGTIPLESTWIHSDTGIAYKYINDGNSNQWVQSTLPLGPQGPQGANGTNVVNSSTATTFTGLLKGNGSVVIATTVLTEIGFTPENVANKENTTLDTSSTKYPTNNLVKTSLDNFADDVDYAIMVNQRILFNF